MRILLFSTLLLAGTAHQALAQTTTCGKGNSGATYIQVHLGANNQLIWCADPTFWSQHSADVTPFFTYYDDLLPVIGKDFGVTAPGPFYISVDPPTGAASTPTPFGQGVNVTGDAFYDVAYNVPGFWGYLLGTHEFVNQWTGILGNGGGWPNDWWADHRSPFPNCIDPILLAQMGQQTAATAQYNRFIAGGDSADPEVVMFTKLFNTYGQWPYFQNIFGLMRADGMSWNNLRDPPNYTQQTAFVSGNPSAMLSDYIVAYFSLAAGVDTSSNFSQSIGIGLQPPNWPSDQTFQPYAVDANAVGVIADAHCALMAVQATSNGASKAATDALANFHKGNYNVVVSGLGTAAACGANCPAECGCDTAKNQCVAKWHGNAATGTSGGGSSSGTNPNTTLGGGSTGGSTSVGGVETVLSTSGTGCNDVGVPTWLLIGTMVTFFAVRQRRDRR